MTRKSTQPVGQFSYADDPELRETCSGVMHAPCVECPFTPMGDGIEIRDSALHKPEHLALFFSHRLMRCHMTLPATSKSLACAGAQLFLQRNAPEAAARQRAITGLPPVKDKLARIKSPSQIFDES